MTEILIGLPFAFYVVYITVRDVGKLASSPVRLPEPQPDAVTTERPPRPQPNGYIRPELEITNLENP
jgi:hypothetical protein